MAVHQAVADTAPPLLAEHRLGEAGEQVEESALIEVFGGPNPQTGYPALLCQPHPLGSVDAGPPGEDLGGDTAPAELLADRPDIDVHPAVFSRPQGGNRRGMQAHDGERLQRRPSLRGDRAPLHRRGLVVIRSTSNQYKGAANRQQTCTVRLTGPVTSTLAVVIPILSHRRLSPNVRSRSTSDGTLGCASAVSVPKRLLFLFSDTGAGHRAAAEAVAAALQLRYPNRFTVECFDPMADQRVVAGRLTALYGPITRHVPVLWGLAYNLTNVQPTVRLFQHAIGRGLRRKLRRALEPRPALVASFHPLPNHVAADVMPHGVPRVTVITDWINFHQAWTDLKADCIICPSQAAYDLCRRRGVPADRLVRAGLPIHPRFQDAIRHASDKPSMRLRLRLRPHAPTVLLAGGGDGTEPLRKYAAALARSPLDVQVLAVCGRNQTLARRIREDNHAGVHVFGFVENMPELLLASDLLATRAGPGMIAEGLACGCPLLLTGYLPGQEQGNVRQVLEQRLGQYAAQPDQLVRAVETWFARPPAVPLLDSPRGQASG